MHQGFLSRLWGDRTARLPTLVMVLVIVAAPIVGIIRLWKGGAMPTLREIFALREQPARKLFTVAGVPSFDIPEEALAAAIRHFTSGDIPLRIQRRAFSGVYVYVPKSK